MRLCIAVKDYIRTQIISKKINTKFFQEEGTEVRRCRTCWLSYVAELMEWFGLLISTHISVISQELKLKYYNLMIQVDQHEGSYLSICKHYRAIYDTPCILEDSSKWQQVRELGFPCSVDCGLVSCHKESHANMQHKQLLIFFNHYFLIWFILVGFTIIFAFGVLSVCVWFS